MKPHTHFKDGKRELHTVEKRGEAMGVCATFNRKYLCCNVHVLRSVHNCPFECTYCFLQNYLTDGATKTVKDIDKLMREVKEKISGEPHRFFRIGTWELGDSLALEKKTGQALRLIEEFSSLKNAVLELKTKSDRVDSILNAKHKGRTVISWSLNTESLIEHEERGTASLQRRLEAMGKVQKAGYLIGLHFDPMIFHDGWKMCYEDLVCQVFETLKPDRLAWISMGSLRFNPEMKKKIENNYPDNKLTCAEMVCGDDNKVRYVKPLRIEMYRFLFSELKKHLLPENLLYLCMERWDVWDKVLGWHPDSAKTLDSLFQKSIISRFNLDII